VALCSNGSEPAPGAPLYVWITWLDAKAWLGSLWGVFSWLGLGAHASIEAVNTFCATEPTQPVYPGDATVLAAARDPIAFEACLTYIEDSARWWVWANTCVCSTPAAGTCYPVLNTGALGSTGGDSQNYRWGAELYAKVSGLTIYGMTIRFQAVGGGTFDIVTVDQHDSELHTETFAGVAGLHTYYLATPMPMNNTGSGNIYDVIIRVPNAGYHLYYNTSGAMPIDTTQLHYNKYIYQSDLTSGMQELFNQTQAFDPVICTADPNPAPYDPAPPDPPDTDLPVQPTFDCTDTADLCELVNNLVVQVAATKGQVDLIQRQNVPFAYIVGTVHSALTGTGSITVQGLIGLLIQTSTIPAAWGTSTDDPARYIPSPVSVAVGTTDGDQDQHFCHLVEELWFPEDMGAMTRIHYAFRPGCGGAITELKREP
jgi:hypothetical protein